MNRTEWIVAGAVVAWIAGCGGSVKQDAAASSSGAGGSQSSTGHGPSTSPSTGTDGPATTTGGGGHGGAVTTTGGGGAGTGGSGTGGAGGASMCGGFVGTVCPMHTYCSFFDGSCGGGDQGGVCKPEPLDCSGVPTAPVCACDNKVYPNACLAEQAGVDVAAMGACPLNPGQFACGGQICDAATEYCFAMPSIQAPPGSFACTPLPAGCGGSPACACLAAVQCGMFCMGQGTTGLTATCPAEG